MLILSHKDIAALDIDPVKCYEWADEMLRAKDRVILPAKTSIKPSEEIFYNVMPSILPENNTAGVKVVTRYPERTPSLDSQIMTFDLETGRIKAFMDGNYITTMRTGAVAAHSVKLLAVREFYRIGLIGLGNQARAVVKVIASIFPGRRLEMKLFVYKDQHILFENFVRGLPGTENYTFIYSYTYDDTIRGSDVVISSVTYFASDICENDCFDEGCLLVPIHTRGFMNCDLFFDKIFADDTAHVKGFKYFDRFREFAEVTDVLSGRHPGRTSDKERLIAYNIGLSMHDVYFAEMIYKIAAEKGIGSEAELCPPVEKFWI